MENKITMGNDEFILYIRKKEKKCSLTNDQIGLYIWLWILKHSKNIDKEKDIIHDVSCEWFNKSQVAYNKLPKTSSQMTFDRDLLPRLYSYIDSFVKINTINEKSIL
jgi:hypothetical protein